MKKRQVKLRKGTIHGKTFHTGGTISTSINIWEGYQPNLSGASWDKQVQSSCSTVMHLYVNTYLVKQNI